MFNKKFFVFILICLITKIHCLDDYKTVDVLASNHISVNIPSDSNMIIFGLISLNNNTFSAYLLDYSSYIVDVSNNNFSNGDILGNNCKYFTACNSTIKIDYRVNYVLVIYNENKVINGEIEYQIISFYNSEYSILIVVCSIVGIVLVTFMIGTSFILLIQKCKK